MTTIKFKSTPVNWRKEYLGLKNNTIRKQDDEDDVRFNILKDFVYCNLTILNIEIKNTETKEVFSRLVTDVTLFDDYFIISWKGEKESK